MTIGSSVYFKPSKVQHQQSTSCLFMLPLKIQTSLTNEVPFVTSYQRCLQVNIIRIRIPVLPALQTDQVLPWSKHQYSQLTGPCSKGKGGNPHWGGWEIYTYSKNTIRDFPWMHRLQANTYLTGLRWPRTQRMEEITQYQPSRNSKCRVFSSNRVLSSTTGTVHPGHRHKIAAP